MEFSRPEYFPFSRGSSQPRDWTRVSCIAGGFFTNWVTREAVDPQQNPIEIKCFLLLKQFKNNIYRFISYTCIYVFFKISAIVYETIKDIQHGH